MRNKKLIAALVMFFLVTFSSAAQKFVDYGPASSFLDLEVQALAGRSMITENYVGCFPEISQMNASPGSSIGVGATAVFGIRNWLGIGTSINLLRNHYRIDMAVAADDASSMSNIFIRNSATYMEIPVFLQFRFNIARNVKWRVNAGLFYAYGIGGNQRQDIYNAQVNQLGQLVSTVMTTKCDYFGDSRTFINAFRRSDIGLHLATSLLFGRVSIGGNLNFGFKNAAYIPGGRGIITPNIHNFNYALTLGCRL